MGRLPIGSTVTLTLVVTSGAGALKGAAAETLAGASVVTGSGGGRAGTVARTSGVAAPGGVGFVVGDVAGRGGGEGVAGSGGGGGVVGSGGAASAPGGR